VVKHILIFAALIILPIDLFAVTADELREMSADINREKQQSEMRVKTRDAGSLLKADDQTGTTSVNTDRQNEKKMKFRKKDPAVSSPSNNAGARSVPAQPGPVPTGEIIISDAVSSDIKAYGIRIGTWMQGSINRNVSSAEPGLVEITLTADVVGDKRTLKAGTILFAQKQLNNATKRLDMVIQKGITPNGHEFKATGFIFDTSQVSGLPGIISGDNTQSIKRGLNKGVLAAAGAATRMLSNTSIVGSAAGAASGSLTQDRDNLVEQTTEQQLTVYVSPQPVLIRVDQTF